MSAATTLLPLPFMPIIQTSRGEGFHDVKRNVSRGDTEDLWTERPVTHRRPASEPTHPGRLSVLIQLLMSNTIAKSCHL